MHVLRGCGQPADSSRVQAMQTVFTRSATSRWHLCHLLSNGHLSTSAPMQPELTKRKSRICAACHNVAACHDVTAEHIWSYDSHHTSISLRGAHPSFSGRPVAGPLRYLPTACSFLVPEVVWSLVLWSTSEVLERLRSLLLWPGEQPCFKVLECG